MRQQCWANEPSQSQLCVATADGCAMCVIRWLSVQCLDMESESESTPELHEMTINFMPESYAFRPHGMYVRSNSPLGY